MTDSNDTTGRGEPTAVTTTDLEDRRPLSRRRFMRASAAAGAGALALGGTSTAAAQAAESCESFDTIEVGSGDFWVINNDWGADDVDMCVWAENDGTYGYRWDTRTSGGEPNYPQALVGTKPWGDDTGVPSFPIRRGDVDELTLEFDVDLDVSGGEWNLAEEWWLMDGQPDADDAPHTHEIMVVFEWSDQHDHGQPVETNAFTDAYGNQFDYWVGYAAGGTEADFHIFRVAGGATSGRFDLTAVMDYVEAEIGGVRDDLLLSGIELGNEYWQGVSGDVTFNTFNVTVNGQTYTSGNGTSVGGGTGGSGGDDWQGDGGQDGQNGSNGDQDGGSDGQNGSDGQQGGDEFQDGDAWDADAVYHAGDQVTHDGTVWEAQWWTQGQEPREESWYVWQPADGSAGDGQGGGTDDGSGTDQDGGSDWDGDGTDGQNDSGGDQGGSDDWQDDGGDDSSGGATGDGWDPNEVYTAGDRVTHDGSQWEAQWWTQNQEPGASQWGPWQQVE